MSSRSREPVSSYGYGVFTDTIIIAIDGGSRTSSQTAEQILGTSSSITWQETLTLFALFSLSLFLSQIYLIRRLVSTVTRGHRTPVYRSLILDRVLAMSKGTLLRIRYSRCWWCLNWRNGEGRTYESGSLLLVKDCWNLFDSTEVFIEVCNILWKKYLWLI